MTTERDAARERQATLANARAEIAAMTPEARREALSRAKAHLARNPSKHLAQRIALLEEAERDRHAAADERARTIVAGLPWDVEDERWPTRRLASWRKE